MWSDRRRLGIALGVSALANLFLVGVLAGRSLTANDPRVMGRGRPLVPGVLVRALPPEDRKTFAKAMRAHKDELERRHRALADAKTAAEADIAAPVYDRAKVEADFAAVRAAVDAEQAALHAAYADALATLGPSARAALVPRQAAEK
jgi:uncharacterized membrane protein